MTNTKSKHRASCHCGKIQIEVDIDLSKGATRCNCSICHKLNSTGGICKPEELRVLGDESTFSTYAWGGKTATRYFCPVCGVFVYGRGNLPELGGDYITINYQCLDDVDTNTMPIVFWDGRHNNWHAGPRSQPWPIFATTMSVQNT